MSGGDQLPPAQPRRGGAAARAALAIAIAADAIQVLLVPAFVEGWFSPANDVLDVLVAILMVGLLGWHPAFLPSFIAELMPVLGLFPTWTVAVLFVTRRRASGGAPRLPEARPPDATA